MSACFVLPEAFRQRMAPQLPDLDALEAALNTPPPVSIRLHPSRRPDAWAFPFAGTVPWCPQGRYLAERPSFTADPLFHAGAYYVQEASSMLLWQFIPQGAPLLALDLCAAPGGKTTLLADALPEGSELVANEVIASRATILRENAQRWGNARIRVCQNDPEELAKALGPVFDLVVVDAPCSGEGLWRKQPEAVAEWSPEAVAHCAARQGRILQAAWQCLKPGGRLVYSTCTYAQDENIARLAALAASQPDAQPLAVDLPEAWGFLRQTSGEVSGWQAMPHRVQGEGFFIGALQKAGRITPAEWVPGDDRKTPLPKGLKLPDWLAVPPGYDLSLREDTWLMADSPTAIPANRLRWLRRGVLLAERKGKDWIPAHEAAFYPAFHADRLSKVALSKDQALRYLKGGDPGLSHSPVGWVLLTYLGLPLGWAKHLGNRTNNALPKGWRIRQDLDKL
ncbi:MAG: methyltransferase domain-containing protein [Bacteroidetes bacterium]|nr:methyltransferase domain-containing protein [Bacteroidota bacterium]